MNRSSEQAPIDQRSSYLDAPESVGAWLTRLVKGVMVGVGFILPGLSGGVLAVIFRIYDPIIRFLSKPFHRFVKQVFYFIPIGIGAAAFSASTKALTTNQSMPPWPAPAATSA